MEKCQISMGFNGEVSKIQRVKKVDFGPPFGAKNGQK